MARLQWQAGQDCWLCLQFSALALDEWLRLLPGAPPLALVQGQQLQAVSAGAEALGLVAGINLSSALALCPQLQVRPLEPGAEARLLAVLARWAGNYTPRVVCEDNRLLLEIASCLRLFGGLEALLAQLLAALDGQGWRYSVGLARTAAAARLLATAAQRQAGPALPDQRRWLDQPGRLLADLSLDLLPLPATCLRRLQQAGFRQLAQLLPLPAAAIGKRFGKPCLLLLQRLTGQAPEPLADTPAAPLFQSSRLFLYGLADWQRLEQPMQALLAELGGFLRSRQLASRQLVWQLTGEDRSQRQLVVQLQQAHGDVAEFFRLSRLKLEGLQLSSAIERLQLTVAELQPARGQTTGLFRELGQPGEALGRLLDRLSQRLSAQQLFGLQLQSEHLPERDQQPVPAAVPGKRLPVSTGRMASALCSPWLVQPPEPLVERAGKLIWRGRELLPVGAPERLDSHWWCERQRRDYVIARAGERYLQLYFCHRQQQWFVAGVYVC